MTKTYTYRGWDVSYDPPPIPTTQFDWQATHRDYDGPEDNRIIYAASRAAVQLEIDEWIADNETCPRTRRGWLVAVIFALAMLAVYVAVAASIYFGVW